LREVGEGMGFDDVYDLVPSWDHFQDGLLPRWSY
jgi:hypothetical protein